LWVAGETETMQENIQDWLELDEGDPGFQFMTEKEIAAVIFLFIFRSTTYTIKFTLYLCPKFFAFWVPFGFTNLDYCLIRMASPPSQSRLARVYCTEYMRK
jgi:hypothetical protein